MTHKFELRVYYEDTDCMGVVYYANYLRFAERARTEYLRAGDLEYYSFHGQDTPQNHKNQFSFMVRKCEIKFYESARLDDLLYVETAPILLPETISLYRREKLFMIDFAQKIYSEEKLLTFLIVNLVFVDKIGKPCQIPANIASYFGIET